MAENEAIQTISRVSGPIQDWGLYRKSLLFAELARIAYLHEEDAASGARQIGFPQVEFFDVDGAQAYLFSNEHDLVLACRGTEPREWNDVKADINAWPVIAETIGRVHSGFKKEADDLWPVLEQRLIENTKECGCAAIPSEARWRRFMPLAVNCRISKRIRWSYSPMAARAWAPKSMSLLARSSMCAG